MGVSGLLPVLKQIQKATTLESYRGKTLAIDSYAWLHKAVFACSMQLVMGEPTTAYINYILKRLTMLQHFDITPYFVFDGDYLPTKGDTESERARKRSEYKELAQLSWKKGDKKNAAGYFNKACDVSPEIAKSLITVFQERGIKYVVAPYEADSQMVFLEKEGIVDGIISEDSDLLIFGCQLLITKLSDSGECIEIKKENFKKIRGSPIGQLSDTQLKLTAIISGCDYTKGVPGVGVVKALNLVKRFASFQRVVMGIKFDGKLQIPASFEEEHNRAMLAFDHQIVYNPKTQKVQYLNELENASQHSKEYLHECTGSILDDHVHRGIANGDLDPFTKKPLNPRDKYSTGSSSLSAPPSFSVTPNSQTLMKPFGRSNTVNMAAVSTSKKPVNTLDKFLTPASHRTHSCPTLLATSESSNKKCRDTIDRFFTKTTRSKINDQLSKSNRRQLSPTQTKIKISPLAKRAKLVTSVLADKPLVASRFFSKNLSVTEKLSELMTTTENENVNGVHTVEDQINSSDFVLTDPDDDNDDDNEKEDSTLTQPGYQNKLIGQQKNSAESVLSINKDDVIGIDDSIEIEEIEDYNDTFAATDRTSSAQDGNTNMDALSDKENDSSILSSDIDDIVTPQSMDKRMIATNSKLSFWKEKFEFKEMTPSKMVSQMNLNTKSLVPLSSKKPTELRKTPVRPALRDRFAFKQNDNRV